MKWGMERARTYPLPSRAPSAEHGNASKWRVTPSGRFDCPSPTTAGKTAVIDNHKLEIEAMRLFKCGEGEKAPRLQDEFLEEVETAGEDHCTCSANCKFHGRCVPCVIIHRGHGDHLPHCFQDMVNKRIEALSELTEHSLMRGS